MSRWFSWPARRPVAALIASLVLALLAAIAVRRIHPDASLEKMMSKDDPAVAAAVRVLNEFPAAEELLVLATAPQADAAGLFAFAERLEAELKTSPDAALFGDIQYRADPQIREYFEKVVVPNGIFYLDPAGFEAARRRLSRDEMFEQFRKNEAMISAPGPGAAAMAKVFIKDPLRLHEFVLDRLAGSRPFKTFQGTDAFVSADGRSILVRVGGRRPVSDLEAAKAMTAAATAAAKSANTAAYEVDLSGAYAIAAASAKAVRADMIESVVLSQVFLAVLFVLAYKRPVGLFVMGFIPVAVGVLYGFGVYALFTSSLTPLTAVIGGILAGMGIDYCIEYVAYYRTARVRELAPEDAVAYTVRTLGPALVAAWATSVVGFLAIGWSKVPALRDFALLGALGLTGAFVGSVIILPAILVLRDRRLKTGSVVPLPRINLEPPLDYVRARRPALVATFLVVGLAAVLVVLAKGFWLPLESDLSVMHPRPNPALEAQAKIAQRMGASPGSLILYLKGDTPEALTATAHRVRERLAAATARDAGVTGTYGLATLLPDPPVAAGRVGAIKPDEIERIVADFRAAVAQSAFAPDAFEPYIGFLRHLFTEAKPPTMADVLARPGLAKTVLPQYAVAGQRPPAEAMALVFLDRPLEDTATRAAAITAIRSALKDVPGATLTGLGVVSHDMQEQIQADLPRLTLLAIALVLAYLVAQLRSARDTLLALVPMTFSLAVTLAVAHLAGLRLNMINLAAVPLLIGITVDYAVFIVNVSRLRRTEPADVFEAQLVSSAHTILLCAATTFLGFGSLAFTSVPAVRSLGLIVATGVTASLLAALLCLLPIIAPPRARETGPR